MNKQEPLSPTEQNNMYGGVTYNQAPGQPQTFQQPQTAEPLEEAPQYIPNENAYQPDPNQPVYNGYAYAAPVTSVAPKKARKGNPVTMLLMTFITFVCMVMLPWLSFAQLTDCPVHVTDVVKVSSIGLNMQQIHKGDLINLVNNELNKYSSSMEYETEKLLFEEITKPILDFVDQSEINIIRAISIFKFYCRIALIACVILAAFWIVLVIAAAKGMKKLYSLLNIVLLVVTAGAVVAIGLFLSFGSVGSGLLLTMAMLVVSIIVGCVSKAKEVTAA